MNPCLPEDAGDRILAKIKGASFITKLKITRSLSIMSYGFTSFNPLCKEDLFGNPQGLSSVKYSLRIMSEPPSSQGDESYWFNRGNELLSSGQYLEALDSYDRAIEIISKDSDAWNNRGLALASLKRYEDALKSFDKAGALNPSHPDAWYNKGMVLCALGLFEDAVWSFDKALEINPRNAHAWHNKGVALSRLGRGAEARFAISCAGWIGMHEI